jgi:predicted nucleic acid-binding protein
MRVVDTSAWIEFLAASPAGTALAAQIPARDTWLVPTIVQLELAKWLTREAGEDKSDQVTAFTELCVVAPLDTKTALTAATLSARHRLATADAIIYATALLHDAGLLTCDAHFDGLAGVVFIPKSGQSSKAPA